jgi:hypothetical protein
MSTKQTTVVLILAEDIRKGVTIWAPDDGDWLKVSRIEDEPDYGTITVYRRDGSEAQFGHGKSVLMQVSA